MTKGNVTCDVCGFEDAKVRHVSRTYGKRENIVVIDNVPIVVCPRCGESYLTAETMQEVERLKLHGQKVKAVRRAPVIQYV